MITREIQLTTGEITLIDDSDYEVLSQWKWRKTNYGYAGRMKHISGGWRAGNKKVKLILMHRLIMDVPEDMQTDHINGDRLDNRRSNLRIVTQLQNAQNSRKMASKNPFMGTCLHKPTGKWQAQIRLWGKLTYLGLFESREAAAEIYKESARKNRGEFSHVD